MHRSDDSLALGRGDGDGAALDQLTENRLMACHDADRAFGAWRLGASVNGSSHRYDDLANDNRMGGYATTDLRVGYAPSAAWSLQLSANNIFDRQYETARWYNQAGRTWLLSLRWQPGQ